jgi:hypothetical protein
MLTCWSIAATYLATLSCSCCMLLMNLLLLSYRMSHKIVMSTRDIDNSRFLDGFKLMYISEGH